MSLDITFTTMQWVEVEESHNITHNVTEMAKIAGVYELLWHSEPEAKAGDLIPYIEKAIDDIVFNPDKYRPHENKEWGSLKDFTKFLVKVLDTCKTHPEATIEVSR